jgi:hypothetical protein
MTGIEELAERVADERGSWPGKRWRCSKQLRQEIVAAATELLGTGMRLGRVAGAVGVKSATLGRWLKTGRAGVGHEESFRRVEVIEAGHEGCLTLVTPAGYRVEGLSLGGVERLLAALG